VKMERGTCLDLGYVVFCLFYYVTAVVREGLLLLSFCICSFYY